jgi:hypothetical protein
MAAHKTEFLAQRYRGRLRPAAHYSMGALPRWLHVVGHLPGPQLGPEVAQDERAAPDVWPPVFPQVAPAAVGGDEAGVAPDVVAVVEPEVGGHTGEQHEIGLSQGLPPPVPRL